MDVKDEQVGFNIIKDMEYLETTNDCFAVNVSEKK